MLLLLENLLTTFRIFLFFTSTVLLHVYAK